MKVEVNEVFPIAITEEGTVMDFVDQEWVFVIKDEKWTSYECQALQNQPLSIDFVYKYDIAIFLLTVEDVIDTSDFIFCCHDNIYDAALWKKYEQGSGAMCTLYLLDEANVVKGKRRVCLSTKMSNCISECLQVQKEHSYVEEEFACNLEGLQAAYEPFELQPLALASETF